MRKIIFIMGLISVLSIQVHAIDLSKEETTLKGLFNKLYRAPNDSARALFSDSLCVQLSSVLLNEQSFQYAFDSLPYLGKIYSTDHKLRIYSWNYISDAGDYRFFNYFQFVGNKLFKLEQNRPGYIPEENRTIESNNWYGALYYNAIPFNQGNQTCYILLGWSHNPNNTNFKTIDVVAFKDSTMIFGSPIFLKGTELNKRITLPYSSEHALALQYDPKRNLFIFNHLNESGNETRNKENKIPDETFSGYQWSDDKYIYKEDVTFDHQGEDIPRTKVEYGLESGK